MGKSKGQDTLNSLRKALTKITEFSSAAVPMKMVMARLAWFNKDFCIFHNVLSQIIKCCRDTQVRLNAQKNSATKAVIMLSEF